MGTFIFVAVIFVIIIAINLAKGGGGGGGGGRPFAFDMLLPFVAIFFLFYFLIQFVNFGAAGVDGVVVLGRDERVVPAGLLDEDPALEPAGEDGLGTDKDRVRQQ